VANAGAIEFDKDVVGANFRNIDFLDFDSEVWAFIYDNSGFTFLRDIVGFDTAAIRFRSHDC